MIRKPAKPKAKTPKPYHHGNLVEALIAVTVEIIEERGVEHVSVREAAKRAGVSPGAPFQHFRSKTTLLTAVAEQAMGRLTQAVAAAQLNAAADKPIAVLEAIGRGYLNGRLPIPRISRSSIPGPSLISRHPIACARRTKQSGNGCLNC